MRCSIGKTRGTTHDAQPFHREDAFRPTASKRLLCQTLGALAAEDRHQSMASKFRCTCGNVVRTNLYEGHGLHLLVPEGMTDVSDAEVDDSYVDRLVQEARVVAKCSQCGNLAIIDNEYKVQLYAPIHG